MKNGNSGDKSSESNLKILSNSFDIKNSFNFKNPVIIKKFEKRENLSLKPQFHELSAFPPIVLNPLFFRQSAIYFLICFKIMVQRIKYSIPS